MYKCWLCSYWNGVHAWSRRQLITAQRGGSGSGAVRMTNPRVVIHDLSRTYSERSRSVPDVVVKVQVRLVG